MNQQNKNQKSNVNLGWSMVNGQWSMVRLKGFSLMELMIVIAFIGIMSAITITSLNASRTKKAVEGTAREVSAAIREAQNGALTGKKINATDLPCNYYFNWVSGSSYSITYQYHTGSSSDCLNGPFFTQTLATYTTKNGVIINPFGVNIITFQVPFANTSGVSPSTMPILINKGGISNTVCVSTSGNVWENSNPGTCP